jgi:hypothetical protein
LGLQKRAMKEEDTVAASGVSVSKYQFNTFQANEYNILKGKSVHATQDENYHCCCQRR